MKLQEQSTLAKQASRQVRTLSTEIRNQILFDFADGMIANADQIIKENAKDLENAKNNGMSKAMLDRLTLTLPRIESMAEGVRQVAELPDPLNKVLEERTIQSGITLTKKTSAIGVIGIIFESRPNVTADCSALCIKAGSACILKGGKESYLSCLAVVSVMKEALRKNHVDENAVMLAEKPSHEEVAMFMADRSSVDLLIPRGGKNLIRSVVDNAKVPVIETGAGVCHVYVEKTADFEMAKNIVINAKCQRPSVCNAMETLLVHQDIKETFLPIIVKALEENGVLIYGDIEARNICPSIQEAADEAWGTEYNDLIMNLKIVKDTDEAIQHIETYGTHHSEAIVSQNKEEAQYFMNQIDSACVYHNASSRFTDGFEFGLGAEIGISTQKLHARGPMGLNELTTYTYHLEGNGETR